MKCFIASAFGHTDVDLFYDKVVAHVLHNAGIEALRVDRVLHNEDIDDKIVQLMNEADFAVADLTYARPSVYYEAGYIQGRGKPVIYTSRNDHFRQRDNDQHGNYAIHFDLKMRNIIDWSASDGKVAERLSDRIRYVTKPLRDALTVSATEVAERAAFKKKPLTEQLRIIRNTAFALLRPRGFSVDELSQARCAKIEGKTRVVWSIHSRRAFLKKNREAIRDDDIFGAHAAKYDIGVKDLKTTIVCASPGPIPRNPFRGYFSSFAETDDGSLHRLYRPKDGAWDPPVPHEINIRFIDKIESESDFRTRFKVLLASAEIEN